MDDPYNAFCDHAVCAVDGAPAGPLAGLTFAAQDVIDIADYRTGAGNPDWLMSHDPAARHAPVVEMLLAAGASLAGKTRTDELSLDLLGENPHDGTPINPNAHDALPGGAASGAAVAVAAGMVDFALGVDSDGAVRTPASFCGVYGFRPTHGRLPLDGVLARAQSFACVGWLAQSAKILAQAGEVLLECEIADDLPDRLVIATDGFAAADSDTGAALATIVEQLSATVGASQWQAIAPENSSEGLHAWAEHLTVLQAQETWATLGTWIDRTNPRFGFEAGEALNEAVNLNSARITAAQKAWPAIVSHLYALLRPGTVICLPTTPFAAPARSQPRSAVRPLRRRIAALASVASLLGAPQVTLPLARVGGAPVGLSLIGRPGSDGELLGFAHRIVAMTGL